MTISDNHVEKELNSWDLLKEFVKKEFEQTQRELKEITLMLEQSQVEVDKLGQRNATITMHLQQVHSQFESLPKEDIRVTYDAALDAQQRLAVMRGQLEKLQGDEIHLDRYIKLLGKVQEAFEGDPTPGAEDGRGAFATAEMIIQAQETERQRLSRQMHDGPAQALSNFILQTEIAMRLFDINQDRARDELANLKSSASNTFQQVRDFIFDLRPMMLDDLGLTPTMKRYVEAFREKSGMDVNVRVTGVERRLESYLEVMIFRAVQELLANSSIHSQASQILVQIDIAQHEVRVNVEDNGKGFDSQLIHPEETGVGMKLIKERVEMLGGNFEVDSAIGQGARIFFNVPIN
jgi:two-component system sensor histidine kinase DegS